MFCFAKMTVVVFERKLTLNRTIKIRRETTIFNAELPADERNISPALV